MITDKMIEAAQDAYMPFGDMGMALLCAFSVSVDKIETDAATLAKEIAKRGQLLTECLEFLTQVIAHCDDVDLAGKAEDLRAKLEQ